ncbi:MAG: 4Fe-4S binding protein [Candidatus Aminicenantes bacterium]|nr:4Fe-4S binding protein [Candidatus Aminicenantes bacterium]
MKELVVISGKGGTGKTSVSASLAALARRPVVADCDVDAADLHLVLAPTVLERHEFRAGHEAVIRPEACNGCGVCFSVCRFGAVLPVSESSAGDEKQCRDCSYCVRSCSVRTNAVISELQGAAGAEKPSFWIDPTACEGCGVCVRFCPERAIDFPERICGEWMISRTRFGPMVHARLAAAAENSGKLVSTVRKEARRIAEEEGRDLILVDGPPGIGCPVIASVTGASIVLVVTEPTVSGQHDLERVLKLAKHFQIPAFVCVNKWDVNPEMAERIERTSILAGAAIAGRIRYDPGVTRAMIQEKAVVETEAPSAEDFRGVWERIGLS